MYVLVTIENLVTLYWLTRDDTVQNRVPPKLVGSITFLFEFTQDHLPSRRFSLFFEFFVRCAFSLLRASSAAYNVNVLLSILGSQFDMLIVLHKVSWIYKEGIVVHYQ